MITVRESIDLAYLPCPVPQVIPLETIHRKPRRTKTAVISQRSGSSNLIKNNPPQIPVVHSSAISEVSDGSLRSPSVSDGGCPSTVSSARIDCETGSVPTIGHGSGNLDGHSVASSDEAMIAPTATVEMLQSGCLPGDTVAVRVAINLTRQFKNPHGIILTLYRECHIDIHPAIPLGSWQNGRKQEYEDYYPKSLTGLGGLSLSSGGSSRVFRQDISQKSTALYVDKQTLAANVKASVPVPEGLFPTISSVPGAMIDFKYYVETIIDLRGRSTIQEHVLPRLSMVNSVPSLSRTESRFDGPEVYDSVKLPLNTGLSFLETSQMRREKGVVTHVSEVVVGTRDSGRNRLKKADYHRDHDDAQMEGPEGRPSARTDDIDNHLQDDGRLSHHDAENMYHGNNGVLEDSHAIDFAPVHDLPSPEIEEHVDEKTRLRRAAEFLLPSAPPQTTGPSSLGQVSHPPSAPAAFEEDGFVGDLHQPGPSAPAYNRSTSPLEDAGPSPARFSSDASSLDDKQELERRRLQAQASSPDTGATINGAALPLNTQATAPVLDESTSAGVYTPQTTRDHRDVETPPRYQA